jgi:UDP-N-acetylglucosamine 2-epimerase (non-hydrolysing)
LRKEGIASESIFVTGNTVIDSLLEIANSGCGVAPDIAPDKRVILITAHRRENFGLPFEQVCQAIRQIADHRSDTVILFPVHPNPNVRRTVNDILSGHPSIILCEPLNYADFVAAMKRSDLILTDSGGVQEEAPALGKPVLVLRAETERPEAVDAGVVKLVGTDPATIVAEVNALLNSSAAYASMARGISPYGDGKAAQRIVSTLQKWGAAESPCANLVEMN